MVVDVCDFSPIKSLVGPIPFCFQFWFFDSLADFSHACKRRVFFSSLTSRTRRNWESICLRRSIREKKWATFSSSLSHDREKQEIEKKPCDDAREIKSHRGNHINFSVLYNYFVLFTVIVVTTSIKCKVQYLDSRLR